LVALLFSFACLRMRYRHGIALEIAIAVGFVVFAFVLVQRELDTRLFLLDSLG
jgi:hypothetical protein